MRFRDVYITIGSLLVLALWIVSDPDLGLITEMSFGASTIATLVILLKSILYVGLLHFSRKALLDYVDLQKVIEKAVQSSDGAGNVVIGIGLMMIAIAIVMFAATTA